MQHMNTGNGEASYANNSFLQETAIRKALPVLKRAILDMASDGEVLGKWFRIADLGCSTGTNTLLVASIVIDIVIELCKERNHKAPKLQVCLNDLYGNDFNTIFQMLPNFYEMLKEKGQNFGSCFFAANPGSFYDRLFREESLHLVHSSYAIHWLSQVPEGIENNKENIYMAKTSPLNVFEAYRKQFHMDFKKFLQMRSEEIVHGGCMVLTFLGRSIADPASDDCCLFWKVIAQSLHTMRKAGLVQESYINTFNIPTYTPCEDEIRNTIREEGSFSLNTLNAFNLNWDPYDTDYARIKDLPEENHIHGKNTAKVMRAVTEPLLTSHFRNLINIDVLFKVVEKKAAEYLANNKTRHFTLVISMTRK